MLPACCIGTCACVYVHSLSVMSALLQAYGIEQATAMCKRMLAEGTPGLHMYTLNLEKSAVQILENLGLISKEVDLRAPSAHPASMHRTCITPTGAQAYAVSMCRC